MISRHCNNALQTLPLLLAGAFALQAIPARAELSISTNPTQNVSCSAGVCTATAGDAVLNVRDLTGMLAGGDVEVVSGSIAQDIDVANTVTWASNTRLTLDAYHSLAIGAGVTAQGTGALTLTTNDGGSGGTLSINSPVHFWDTSSSLVINGNSYVLVDSVAGLVERRQRKPVGLYRSHRRIQKERLLYPQSHRRV